MSTSSFFCSSPQNAADLLAAEVRIAGGKEPREQTNGVEFTGPLETGYRLCLWSRIASRVMLEITRFEASSADDLYASLMAVDWVDHMDVNTTFAVHATVTKSAPMSRKFAVLRSKDAIADYFREKTGKRPSVDTTNPGIAFSVHVRGSDIRLYCIMSGEGLHRRGYRRAAGPAPLKENVAAALLLRAGWPEIAAEGGALVDPMCGSGTIPIEGALIAGDIAPGLSREGFGFESWKMHLPELWQSLVEEAEERRRGGLERIPRITGFDKDRRSVTAAVESARVLGIEGNVHFEKRELSSALPPGKKLGKGRYAGLVAVNPPYGIRLGNKDELLPLYRGLGRVLKHSFPGWKAAILSGDKDLSMATSLRATKINTLYNGAIPCVLAQCDIHGGQTLESSVSPGKKEIYLEQFGNRLAKNFGRLRKWAAAEGVTCYRVYDADMPEFSAAIDLYEGTWVHVQEYAPPVTIDKKQARLRLQVILETLPDALGVRRENIHVKTREKQESGSQYEHIGSTGIFNEIHEGGLLFLVNFTDYLDSGIFLDHRITRGMIRDMSEGRRFLNLFSYTGSATVYAADGGASGSVSVDNSNTYTAWARDNLHLNGIFDDSHQLARDEARAYLTGTKERFDLIFLDPPTFSRSKRFKNTFQVQRDHVELINMAMDRLSKDGVLLFSTNFKKFKLDYDSLKGADVQDLTAETIPEDYRRTGKIHQLWRIRS